MPQRGHAFETLLWTDPQHLPLVEAVLSLMNGAFRIIGVGGPRLPAVKDLAARLDCPFDDDLRRLTVDHPAAYVLLASLDQVSAPAIVAAMTHGATVLTLEPLAATLTELHENQELPWTQGAVCRAGGRVINIPSFMRGAGWLSAADPQTVLGGARSLAMIVASSAESCSLFSRLHEAWTILLELAAMPESIDCALLSPSRHQPTGLRGLAGNLTAHARMPDGGGAVLHLSETPVGASAIAKQGPSVTPFFPCHRSLQITGEQGQLRVSDLSYELFDLAGRRLDHRDANPPGLTHTFAGAIADHWLQLIDRPALSTGRNSQSYALDTAALACCLACLLSSRTGQAESPERLLSVHRRR
jgi:hypothetical protein